MLHSELISILSKIRVARNFEPSIWIKKKVTLFNEYMRKCGLKACVVSVSGGVDSAVTLALMMKASQQKDSPIQKVLGIAQPIHSTEKIQNRAYEVAKAVGSDIITIDQSDLHSSLVDKVKKELNQPSSSFADGQLRSYMRTPVSFYVAQTLSANGLPCIVLGTGNQDEDGYLFYFCKAGDGVADVQLIADLHKSEVFAVGKALNVPGSILDAPPSADLWDAQTDEEELGFSYDAVELYTSYLSLSEEEQKKLLSNLSADALGEFNSLGEKMSAVHRRNKHKANFPLNLNVEFPPLHL
eukprot:GCRY01001428.1.p1 GENE.GCRY01001428.1~~GCRY01001428.1.p1  ORF type:complete len:298 (-),score=38.89 GCRY01001428.1:913-1806(-)